MKITPYSVYHGISTNDFVEWDYKRFLIQLYLEARLTKEYMLAEILRDYNDYES